MITFAGSSARLPCPPAGLWSEVASQLNRYLARTIMTYIFVLTAGALLPAILAPTASKRK